MTDNYVKDFDGWNPQKKKISDRNPPTFKLREIWWCSTGINVGVEQDGKNVLFERPVLVVRKFNNRIFWGVPLTTKLSDYPGFLPITFRAKGDREPRERRAMLPHMRSYDAMRLNRPMARLPHKQFEEIMQALRSALGGAK